MNLKKKPIIIQILSVMGSPRYLALAFASNVAEGVLRISLANFSGNMINSVIGGNRDSIWSLFYFALIFIAAIMLSVALKEHFYAHYLENGLYKMREKTFVSLSRAHLGWLDKI